MRLLVLLISLLGWASIESSIQAQAPKDSKDTKVKITYDQHIMPILREKCLSCHNADKAKGGLDLSTFSKMMEGGSSGEVVKAGDISSSRLYLLSSHKAEPKMPPNSAPLAKEALDTITAWINGGLLENSGSKAVAAKATADVSLVSIKRGRPDGPPPMPELRKPRDTTKVTPKANAVVALAVSPWAPLVAVGGPKDILLYHGETMALLDVIPFKHGMPTVIKFSRNGSLLLAGGGRGGLSGKVVVWNVKTGQQIIEVGNENDAVLAADISADQTQIALGGPSKMIRIYSTKDGSLVREIKKHTDWIYALEFSPDGVLLASSDRSGGLFVWEAANGREFYNLRGHTAAILDLSWRDDSNILASGSEDGTIRTWEMENGAQTKAISAHGGGVQAVKYAHDNRLVSVGRDRTPKIWDAAGNPQKNFKALNDLGLRVGVSHDAQIIYSGDWTGEVRASRITDDVTLGSVNTNPPAFADRLAVIEKLFAEKQAKVNQAKSDLEAAQKKLATLRLEFGNSQKALTDAQTMVKTLEANLPTLKAAADKAAGDMQAAQNTLKAKEVKVKIFTETATKFKTEVDAAKGNDELLALFNQAKTQLDTANTELAAARKTLMERQSFVNMSGPKYIEAQKNLTTAKTTVQTVTQAMPLKQQAIPATEKEIPPLQQKLAAAEADLKPVASQLELMRAQAKK
ncbi:hypothetical protein KIH39_03335 [Telmatocola sphagniphila]|uniref:Cytochrome c domain-containing protein n=1 Tax=Telmatocola sphagniphila TaxID=1123043 RepID=A0A8E6EYR9_9BACT|nr:c-type cytochrome domain-containing protein [Telmatocola sphagniphila]QVL32963.1 hypothetical protein KIH39_03335 [Telmatocola sphagniphila]